MENVNRLLADLEAAKARAVDAEAAALNERKDAEEKHAKAVQLVVNLDAAIEALEDLRDGRDSRRYPL